MADGSITIDVLASTDKFDRQISDLEKKMKKEEDKKILVEAKLDTQEQDLQTAIEKTNELGNAYQRLSELKEKANKTPTEFAQMQGLESQYGSLEKLDTSFNKALDKQIALEQKVAGTKAQYDGLNQKVNEYKTKIEGVKLQKHQSDVNKIKESFNGVGNSIQKTIGKIGKLALGIFAVRSAYMALRRASSDLASYDEQYATNIEYIRYVLTQMVAPVLRGIVQLAATLLRYINMIVNALFGVNLFSSGSAENFKKMKANAGGVSKAAKEIKKQLLGFDEINVLTDQSDTGTKAGGIGTPDFDLSALEGERPEWMQWIIDNAPLLIGALGGITAALIAIKVFGLDPIKALGIGIMIAGIIALIKDLQKYLEDPSWENFGNVIRDIGLIILGLGIIIGNVPLIVAGAIVIILGLIAKNWDKIKEGFNKAIDWIKGLGDKLWQWFFDNINKIKEDWGLLGVGIVAVFTTALDWVTKIVAGIVEVIRDLLDGLFRGAKQILDGIIQMVRGDFKGGLITILKGIANIIIGILNGLISGINAIIYPIRAIIAALGKVMGKSWSIDNVKIPKIPYLKTGGIINMPNKGTMIGGAIAGESGREGVVPLTDQQAMSELGREIGKNVLVNLTNITTMNGRVISRELKNIRDEQSFAYNT